MTKSRKLLSVLLYALPVAFFIVCYFLIVTSGEDIFQGANSAPNILGDALSAFNHSARLADMFAWSVINFFDYTFSFGVDTVFRLLDVLAAFSIFFMATYCVLRRRPRLRLLDSAVFCGLFLFTMLTSNGPTIYSGFSKIHNYLFISFFSLLFAIPILRRLWGRPFLIKKAFPRNLVMFILAFLFGLSSNVSGIVFLLTLPVYALFLKLRHHPLHIKDFLKNYGLSSIIGVLLSLFLIYVIGPGLAGYEASPAYLAVCDYLPLGEIFTNLGGSLVRILKHLAYNFGKFFLPFAVAAIPVAISLRASFKRKLKLSTLFSAPERRFLIASFIFIVLHILALTQILYPTRLLFPLHLFASALFLFIAKRFSYDNRKSLPRSRLSLAIVLTMLILSSSLLFTRTYLAIGYLNQVKPALEEIKSSSETSLCVPASVYVSKNLPYLHLGQEDFLVDWALPETIYGKSVTFCENML